MTLDFMSIS